MKCGGSFGDFTSEVGWGGFVTLQVRCGGRFGDFTGEVWREVG